METLAGQWTRANTRACVGTELNAERQWRLNNTVSDLLRRCRVGTELNAERQWRLGGGSDLLLRVSPVGTELNAERQWRPDLARGEH